MLSLLRDANVGVENSIPKATGSYGDPRRILKRMRIWKPLCSTEPQAKNGRFIHEVAAHTF